LQFQHLVKYIYSIVLMHVVAVLFSNCDVYCLKVNCTVGEVKTEVRERLQPYLAVQGEHQGSFGFMLAKKELVMVISRVGNALYALLAFHYVMHYEYCGHVVKCPECMERFFAGIPSSAVNAAGEFAVQLGLCH